MKYLILIFLSFLIPLLVSANEQIDISSSAVNVELEESFTVTVSLTDMQSDTSNAEISLPGIENFDVFSQSVSNKYQNINGETQSISELIIQLTPKRVGEFELGPVEIIGDELLTDNEKINIVVEGNSFSAPVENTNRELEINDNQSEKYNELADPEAQSKLGGLREINFPLWGHIAFLIFFIGAFYLLLSYVLKSDKTETSKEPSQAPISEGNQQYKQYFTSLSQEIGDLNSEDFFHQYNIGMRKILGKMGVANYYSATLSEFSSYNAIENDETFKLFKKSYKHEYSGVPVSPSTQKKYIEDILEILNK